MERNYKILSSLATVVLIFVLAISMCSCHIDCNGKECKERIGLKGKETVAQRDSLFKKNNPLHASKFNVFVESSASMDGYVVGNSEFKTTLYRLIGQVEADVLSNPQGLSLNYINSITFNKKQSRKQFTDGLSPSSFSAAGGDRANSDIIDIIENVVKSTSNGEVSMFVSDCVYSPQAAEDLDKALAKQQTDMLNILKNKAKSNPQFSVLVYRFISSFDGIYYTKTNGKINVSKGKRPYFVWFFGDESILASVSTCISTITFEDQADYVVGIPPYKYLPYKAMGVDHPYHYLNPQTNGDGIKPITFIADMSYLPLSQEYILDTSNYVCGGKNYSIKKIEACKGKEEEGKYKYTLWMRGNKNSSLPTTTVKVALKSMLQKTPAWVSAFDDPTGTDYENGYKPDKQRTFGLGSLISGVQEYYNSPDYITFKILIN